MMNRVGMKSDIGLSGTTHEIQARSGDSKACLLWCGVLMIDSVARPMIRGGELEL